MRLSIISIAVALILLMAGCSTSPQAADSPLIGATAPDFNLENTLGGQTSLSEFQGKPVLLFFHMAAG